MLLPAIGDQRVPTKVRPVIYNWGICVQGEAFLEVCVEVGILVVAYEVSIYDMIFPTCEL